MGNKNFSTFFTVAATASASLRIISVTPHARDGVGREKEPTMPPGRAVGPRGLRAGRGIVTLLELVGGAPGEKAGS